MNPLERPVTTIHLDEYQRDLWRSDIRNNFWGPVGVLCEQSLKPLTSTKVRSQLESLHLSHMIVDHVVTKAEIRLKGTRNLSKFRRLIQKTTEQILRKNQFDLLCDKFVKKCVTA